MDKIIQELTSQGTILGMPAIYMFFMLAVFIIGIIVMFVKMGGMKKGAANYLEKYPNAVKVMIKAKAMSGESLRVVSVDGEKPVFFNEGAKPGFYVRPGISKVVAVFTHTRAGAMHRTVSNSTGNVEKAISTEPNKKYEFSYDQNTKNFVLAEI